MSVLDNSQKVTINDNEIELKLTIKDIFLLERELTTGNIMVTLANQPMPMADVYSCLKHMVKGVAFTDDLYMDIIDSLTFEGTIMAIFQAVQKSGVLGKKAKALELNQVRPHKE